MMGEVGKTMAKAAASKQHPEIPELQGWHRAKERARRYNRNLLQYAAALTALLGIGGGSGAVVAVGISFSGLSGGEARWVLVIAIVVAAVVALIALALIYLLIRAFRLRRDAELDAINFLASLIERDPERFWPPPPTQN